MEEPCTLNQLTRLWQHSGSNSYLVSRLSEYMKLVEVAIVIVIGSVEDERTFSYLKGYISWYFNRVRPLWMLICVLATLLPPLVVVVGFEVKFGPCALPPTIQKTFSIHTFIENRVRNRLDGRLSCVMMMYA